jgi:hypothetical protein
MIKMTIMLFVAIMTTFSPGAISRTFVRGAIAGSGPRPRLIQHESRKCVDTGKAGLNEMLHRSINCVKLI